MTRLLKSFMHNEHGLVISAELVIVLTVGVLAMIVGLNGVAGAINGELNDLSSAFGTLDQSFMYRGFNKWHHAAVAGSGYADGQDSCDCSAIWTTGASIHTGHHGAEALAAPPPAAVDGPELVDPCPDGPCPAEAPAPCDPCHATDQPLEPLEKAHTPNGTTQGPFHPAVPAVPEQ